MEAGEKGREWRQWNKKGLMQMEEDEERDFRQTTFAGKLSIRSHRNLTGWFCGDIEAWLN